MKNERIDESRNRNKDYEKERSLDLKRAEERMAQLRGSYRMYTPSQLHFPPEKIPQGWDYLWGRVSIKGEPDHQRQIDLAGDGWTPVPVSRHPEMAAPDYIGGQDKSYIHRGCCILYERPSEYGNKKKRDRAREVAERLSSMPTLNNEFNTGHFRVVNNDFYRAHPLA